MKEEEVQTEEIDDDEQQITLTFDLPLSETTDNVITKEENTIDNLKSLPVNDYVEVITVTESNEKGEIRYALDDYEEIESVMNTTTDVKEDVDKEVVFGKKIVGSIEEDMIVEEIDPIDSPITEMLKERAAERRRKMKDFNYKFNNAKIDDMEKIPAYKRQGVNLNEMQHSSETDLSRTGIDVDDNGEIQLRSNNSFLHDNVD